VKARRVASPRRYTVGITIFVKADGTLGLFENGLRQNVLFLYLLFKAAPNCRRVFLLNHGDGEPADVPPGLGLEPADIVRTSEVIDQLDYVIGLGAGMDAPTVAALRGRGVKMIAYKGGNGAVISMEATVARPPRGDAEPYFDKDYFDAVWMTPQHIHTYRGWCESIYRCPVFEVPQIWSPAMIQSAEPEILDNFGYRHTPGEPWRVGVMDPNITIMKTSHIPMLVCEAAYRSRPAAFKAMYVTNTIGFRDNPHFRSFTVSLTAAQAGLMTAEPRFVSSHFLTNHCDAVVTHHWENGLNYLYYDVLWGGYPLVHNSEFLKDYGYYYETFEAQAGAAALLAAYDRHDEDLVAYKANNQRLFTRLDPTNPDTIAVHERLLAEVCVKG
jgi:hypothetical protein